MNAGKRPKLDLPEEANDYFTSTNDNCIHEVLDRLNMCSLCAIRRTCTKLERLAGEHFQLKYSDSSITLIGSREIREISNITHGKCFRQYIRNLCIDCDRNDKLNISHYIKSKFSNSIRFLCIRFGRFAGSFGYEIKDTLTNVEAIIFHCGSEDESFYENVLKHCPRLKRLEISTNYVPDGKYPTLEYFGYSFHSKNFCETTAANLKRFFQMNPTIKRIDWRFNFSGQCDSDIEQYISVLSEYAKNVEEVFFEFKSTFDAELLYGQLKVIDERKSTKKIEIGVDFADNRSDIINPSALAALTNLTGLYLTVAEDKEILQVLHSFVNLRFLYFGWRGISKTAAIKAAKKLQNLEELHCVDFSARPRADIFENILLPFVSHSTSLSKIFLNIGIIVDVKDVTTLNDMRQKLKFGSKVDIWQKVVTRFDYLDAKEMFNEKFEFVKIKLGLYQWNLFNSNPSHPYLHMTTVKHGPALA